ncbi:phosphonate ABC transporter, permease protein PhnE [Candidatus Bipolaricaulota bacterium]|nr:phosphonate ABC transporter, permease protein PhnE [Candidatus Bipolaricaulota bacterium]
MKDRYYAGFMQDMPAWMKNFRHIRRPLFAFLVDVLTLVYLWTIISYCYNSFALGVASYLTLPWWVMLIVAVEGAALWENLGISVGMKLLGVRVATADVKPPRTSARFVRFLVWHVSGLPLVGYILTKKGLAWHDLASGLRIVSHEEMETRRLPWYRQSWSVAVAVMLVSTIIAAFLVTKVDWHALVTNAGKTVNIWKAFFSPDWSLLGIGFRLLLVTIFMAFMATVFGVVVAVPLSFLAARNLTQGVVGRTVYITVRTVMSVTRSIEPIIWAIIFVVWVRVGAFPGVMALLVHSIADLTKLYSERLESIDPGPVEAIRATGGTKLQVILYGIIPQIINPYLSFTLYRWDINVRMATIIGLVGGGGIGQRLMQYTRVWQWSAASMMMILIMLVVWVMDYSSSRLRARLM